MEGPALDQLGDACAPRCPSPDGETVCEALARYENTLRDAIREIQVDVGSFKLGVERRLEETANLSGPLGRTVAQLQQENRQLRSQLDALTRQVELLSGFMSDSRTLLNSNNGQNHSGDALLLSENHHNAKDVICGKVQNPLHVQTYNHPPSPPSMLTSSPSCSSPPAGYRGCSMLLSPGSSSSPSVTRFSSRAIFAVSSKASSSERDEPIDIDQVPAQQNGHSAMVLGKVSPPSNSVHEHVAQVATRMPHLPITATTKTAEVKSSPSSPPGLLSSPGSDLSPTGQSSPSSPQSQPIEDASAQAVPSVKTWTPTTSRTLGSPCVQTDKSLSAPAKTVASSGPRDTDDGVSDDRTFSHLGERRRDLVRSQTIPRSAGAQARRSIFERLSSGTSNGTPKPASLKRSQSFAVSSASTIKQILLEWCRSKTIGYQNIDIQNFSSSWSNGMAFCALVHSFFPAEFDYNSLSPANRRHNFELAFATAETKAGCDRLIEVDDMMIMGHKPDPMCVFTYVQSLYNHLRKFE
ncbi:smoothelin, like [Oryzias melastigma]|uniref:Smoothelin, like n=2 Tax=Oryzias melastigma TaxID=30732 RepID=A0A3B3CM41_ORYME|nr:smoothelin, like [Oryzias melastigma]XP_024133831.1 smoothelin, like [Oryzias melastigma]XP_024133833.1 smoothelin, like [Oryzias melastigma]XP_036070973.1 smoothelin, like [Oryzias melastigma]